eukprot:scaffold4793_cov175-Amphora_coffeaeformis.AAC.11
MGGPKGCKALRGTDKRAAATLTNMLMTATRSSDGEDAVLRVVVVLHLTGVGRLSCTHDANVYVGTTRIHNVVMDTSKKQFMLLTSSSGWLLAPVSGCSILPMTVSSFGCCGGCHSFM